MRKKMICLLVTVVLLVATSINAFAEEYNYNGYSGNLPVESDEEYNSLYTDWVSRKIIGTDDRYTIKNPHVYPYTAICLIESIIGGKVIKTGTGFLVAPNIIATAGHVLVDNGTVVDRVRCHFGSNGPNCNTCYLDVTAYASNIDIFPGYIVESGAGITGSINDMARIHLGSLDLSNDCGYFGIKSSYGSMLGKNVRISGYPRPSANDGKAKRSIGQVTGWSSTRIEYNNDTLPGDSGAPIFTKDGTGTYIAVGINTAHPTNINLKYNYGIPLTVSRSANFLLGGAGFEPGGGGGFEPVEPGGGGGFEPVN